ncbi:MAG: 1,6-anhydro-N-acetylmuramyl-L-alanine amidase AmpD [Pseudomonadota bacterium]
MTNVDKIAQGWHGRALRCESPNYNARTCDDISLLVIHNISLPPGEYGDGCVQAFFANALDCDSHPAFDELRDMQVSAHFLIERDGQLTQFVSTDERAWHAGVSSFAGRENCNDFSIGIELEGSDSEAYTDAQYKQLAALTQDIMQCYPAITVDRIVGHADIAPGRKTDPGPAFDWTRYRASL